MKLTQHGSRSLFILILVLINLFYHELDIKQNIAVYILGIIALALVILYTKKSVRYGINALILLSIVCLSLPDRNFEKNDINSSSKPYEGKFQFKVLEQGFSLDNRFEYHNVKIINVPNVLSKIKGRTLLLKISEYYKVKEDNIYEVRGIAKFYKSSLGISSILLQRIIYLDKIHNKHSLRDSFSYKINYSKISQDCKGFIFAFLIGDKSKLSNSQLDTFKASGTMHLFAVSGLHVGCLFSIFYFCARLILNESKLLVIIPLAVLWVYVDLVGYSVSSVRACVMITAWCIVKLVRKRTVALYIMVFSMIFCIMENPLSIRSLAFQLSFTVVLTIVWLCSTKVNSNDYSRIKTFFRNLFLVGYGSYWGSFLLILDHFNLILTFSFFINLLLIPFIGLIMIILLLYSASLYIFKDDIAYLIIDFIYNLVFSYLRHASELPFSTISLRLEINNCFHLIYFFSILFLFYKLKTIKNKLLYLPTFCFTTMLLSYVLCWFYD